MNDKFFQLCCKLNILTASQAHWIKDNCVCRYEKNTVNGATNVAISITGKKPLPYDIYLSLITKYTDIITYTFNFAFNENDKDIVSHYLEKIVYSIFQKNHYLFC